MSKSFVEIGQLWRHINREMRALFRRSVAEPDLPVMASYLIRHINEHPGVSVSELSRRARTAKSHVSNVIDQLVTEGYVEKRQDEADQRVVRLFATELAVARLQKAEVRTEAMWLRVMEEVPAGERENVTRFMRTLLTALQTVNEENEDEGARDE